MALTEDLQQTLDGSKEALFNQAEQWLELNNNRKQAYQCYRRAVQLDPLDGDGWFGMLVVLTNHFTCDAYEDDSYFWERSTGIMACWRNVIRAGVTPEQLDAMLAYVEKFYLYYVNGGPSTYDPDYSERNSDRADWYMRLLQFADEYIG